MMSTLKLGALLLLIVVVLSSCLNKEDTVSLKEVTNQIEAAGVDLNSNNGEHQIKLNDVLANEYMIGINEEDGDDWASLSIYIFPSSHDRQKGADSFKDQFKIENGTELPIKYEQKNVIIVYWSNSKEKPRFETEISSAMKKL